MPPRLRVTGVGRTPGGQASLHASRSWHMYRAHGLKAAETTLRDMPDGVDIV